MNSKTLVSTKMASERPEKLTTRAREENLRRSKGDRVSELDSGKET
jgi:hypothetical protein